MSFKHWLVLCTVTLSLLTLLPAQGRLSAEPAESTGTAQAAQIQTPGQLEQLAEALYKYVVQGDITKARETSDTISRLFLSSSFEGATSVEGVNALSSVIIDLKAALNSASVQTEKWEAAAARLRLAANSLNHPRQPLWIQYYKPMQEDLNMLQKAAGDRNMEEWTKAVHRLQGRYEMIRPAALISSVPEKVNRFDSWLSYAAGVPSSAQPVQRERLMEIVSYGNDAVRVMFGKERSEPALSLPVSPQEFGVWGLFTGGFILSALLYTAYRKYRGDKEQWKPV